MKNNYAVSVMLKVVFPYQQTSLLLKFHPTTLYSEVINKICVSQKISNPDQYGLFCPMGRGIWLEKEKQIVEYDVWKLPLIEFKRLRNIEVKVCCIKNTQKLLFNEEQSICDCIPQILKRFKLNPKLKYELRAENYTLDDTRPFLDQKKIFDLDEVIFKIEQIKVEEEVKQDIFIKIFSKPLQIAVDRATEKTDVPPIITQITDFIETNGINVVGIYQKPGKTLNIEKLKEIYNRKDQFDLTKFISSPHDAAGVLKKYLYELPESLLTQKISNKIIDQFQNSNKDTINNKTSKKFLKIAKELLQEIPQINFQVFKKICSHLVLILKNSEQNKMTIIQLAKAFSPIFFRESEIDKILKFNKNLGNDITKIIIKHSDFLFFGKEIQSSNRVFAKVLYNFQPENENDLEISIDEIIEIITTNEINKEEWLTAKNMNGEQGVVPQNYIEILENYDESDFVENSLTNKQGKGKIQNEISELSKEAEQTVTLRKNLELKYNKLTDHFIDLLDQALIEQETIENLMKKINEKGNTENII
ncbi:rho gtpase-activating protein 68f [Anaeramoeba flamelloides]|uniref:Rho gtpase-activating protein 68f n=1 Tax=Anaeramoeba flamelloides TaxID=1746091 RepID=A0AAV7ZCV3_9EUKA|nr:rho gtpase-activating protein 68f [Anaeramoeba flamelloides]